MGFNQMPSQYSNYFFSFNQHQEIDTLEFAPGFPKNTKSALAQLKEFPAPQFKLNHQLLPNFLWMDPVYLGGLLQPNYQMKQCIKTSTQIQAELAQNWNYYFLVNSNLKVYKTYNDTNTFTGAWVKYANTHREIPIAAISFWAQIQPYKAGASCNAKLAYVFNNLLPDSCYVHNSKGKIISRKYASPLTPASMLQCDFITQSIYVDSLLNALKRPINWINENGEVFRLYEDDFLAQDKRILSEKNKFPNLNWNEFQALKRLEKEIVYRNSFMQKTALKDCRYTVYAIDGQNKYRHDYKTIRTINSQINNQFYATPDFYPRYPDNWKKWKGPWHGLKWLNISRKTEIALGDNLFSPFVAAGWDSIETNNIRPAQWLGLMKILGALGAEFYYPGFFNTEKRLAIPENYIWQAVVPVYAQAVTSYYEDILRNSALDAQEDLITYPENDVPLVIRKSKNKPIWVIACSWQTGTNLNKNIGFDKTIKVDLGHKTIKVRARRQGSVYVYSEENNFPTFYQIDGWHQYMHPYYWSKNITLEAELYSNKIITESLKPNDYSNFTSAVILEKQLILPFESHTNDETIKNISFWIKNKYSNCAIQLSIDDLLIGKIELKSDANFINYNIAIPEKISHLFNGKHRLSIDTDIAGVILDKIEINKN